MKNLKLSNSNLFTLVDDEDFDNLNEYKWYASKLGYPRATINKRRFTLHRYLLQNKLREGLQVDHKNNNPLDNRRVNLRVCTGSQNLANTRKRKNTSSKYKGVRYDKSMKRRKRWMAQTETYNKVTTIGRFLTEEEAALAYNQKAKEIWGEFAKLNEINQLKGGI